MKSLTDWRELEERIGLEQLPAFHRSFLAALGVENTDIMPLRKVQQNVIRELNKLKLEGRAQKTEESWLIESDLLEGLKI